MDITIPQKDLLRVLECHTVCDKKSPLPVLANVLLTAADGVLTAQATDLYLAMSDSAPCQIAETGSIALPGKDLFDRVKHMPIGDVQLRVADDVNGSLRSVGGKRYFTDIIGIPGPDYPPVPTPGDGDARELPSDVLRALFASTHYAACELGKGGKEGRDYALLEWVGDRVRMVATDGHRLSKMEATVGGGAPDTKMLIPMSAFSAIRKLVEPKGIIVKIQRTGPYAFFSIGSAILGTKLIDTDFPDFERLIRFVADGTSRTVQVPRVALSDALEAARVTVDGFGGVVLRFCEDVLRVESKGTAQGSGGDELGIQPTGPESTVATQVKYLLDALGSVGSEDVLLGTGGDLSPVVIRPADGSDFIGFVQAMRM